MSVCDISSGATYTGFSLLSKNGEKEEVYSHTNDNQPPYVTKENFNILICLLLLYTWCNGCHSISYDNISTHIKDTVMTEAKMHILC